MAAAGVTGRATANAQPIAAHLNAKGRVFMLLLFVVHFAFNRSASAVVLQIFEDRPRLLGWEVCSHAHMEQDGLPLRRGPFRGITLGMAPIAMDRIELCAAEFSYDRLRFLCFSLAFLLW